MTEYLRPTTLADAIAARAAHPDWMVLAGGTDLMVNATHRPEPVGIVDLWGCAELRGVTRDRGAHPDRIRIGAGTPWLDVIASADVVTGLPILAAAAREIGALQIQARGTIGGNIVTSSPVGDSLPVLLALDASLELASPRGRRTVAYRDFCTGYRTTLLAADELVAAVVIPVPDPATRLSWRKVGTRAAQSISKVMAAAAIHVENGAIVWARFGLGAVAARPIRPAAAEAAATGRAPDATTARAVADALAGEIKPISDVRSAADYRLEVAQRLLMRFVINAGKP
ncbi:MAG TPA: FAD binding domain-containing protein [Kofleriaceae bacterium]|nr:FAD binding domain-containing protein [Kofleriaceae bacterium]